MGNKNQEERRREVAQFNLGHNENVQIRKILSLSLQSTLNGQREKVVVVLYTPAASE